MTFAPSIPAPSTSSAEVLDRAERAQQRAERTRDRRRERALGNSVVPQCSYVIGRIIRERAYLDNSPT